MYNVKQLLFISLLCTSIFSKKFTDIQNDLEVLVQQNDIKLTDNAEFNEEKQSKVEGVLYKQFTEGFCLNRINSMLETLIKYSSHANVVESIAEELRNMALFCDYSTFTEIKAEIKEEVSLLGN